MLVEEFNRRMTVQGYVIIQRLLDEKLLREGRESLHRANYRCKILQQRNGVYNSENTVHHLLSQGKAFRDILQEFAQLDEYFTAFFGGKYILNSYGGNLLTRGASYANNIHRDIRTFCGDLPLMLNTIVMLDDFTAANGATWLLPGSHTQAEKPSEEDFWKGAVQAIAPAGSVLIFNSNLWHAAGENTTDDWRRSVTPMLSRPFIKPQFDYYRALRQRRHLLTPYLEQLAGWNSRIPSQLTDWYQPLESRFYKGDQG